jgi:hypothetical protein
MSYPSEHTDLEYAKLRAVLDSPDVPEGET